jgi:ribosomal protein S18 acetylase RimI-like enzyme
VNTRAAELSDAAAIANVHIASWQSAYRGLISDSLLDGMSLVRRALAWQEILSARRSTTLVADVDGSVVGFADFGPARDEDLNPRSDAELNALYVEPAYWSRGFGFCLWSRMRSLLRLTDFSTLVLWVLESNQRGRHFYERQGCLLDVNAKKVWRPQTESLVEVRYSIPLERDLGGPS